MRVVFHLAGLYQAGVEFLVGTQINDLPDDFSPRCSQSDDVNPFRLTPRTVAVCVDGAQRHNTFPFQISKVLFQGVAVTAVDSLGEIANRDNTKPRNFCEGPNLARQFGYLIQ